MTDCYSVHLIKWIVMTFHLFTFNIALVFSDESNEKTEWEGSTSPLYSISLAGVMAQKNNFPHSLSGLRPKCGTAAGSSLMRRPDAPHFNMLLLCNLRATDPKNPEVK